MFESLKFPIGAWIILIHEVLERYSFYGMRGSLTIFLNQILKFSDNDTMIIFHVFAGFCYFTPIIGAIIADNYIGPFKTVAFIGIIYLIGHSMLPLAAIWANKAATLTGIFILAFGAGGIKSSVAAFGGDQIDPNNKEMIEKYFSLFYTSINIGAFLASFITPILARDVACIGDRCYPLAFGVPAAIFLITYILFLCGKCRYKIIPASKNILSQFIGCVYRAIVNYFKSHNHKKHDSLMDYASTHYSKSFIEDSKKAFKIIVIFCPLPIYWALYDQQGSSWTLQAKYMDGKLGSFFIKPSQLQSINPLLIIIFIPIFDFIIYPLFEKMKILRSQYSRLVVSYAVTSVAFIITASIHILIKQGQTVNYGPTGALIHTVNGINGCNMYLNNNTVYPGINSYNYSCNDTMVYNGTFLIQKNQMKTILFSGIKHNVTVNIFDINIVTDEFGHVRTLLKDGQIYLKKLSEKRKVPWKKYRKFDVGIYDVYCNTKKCGEITIVPGLTISLYEMNSKLIIVEEFKPKLIHVLWQLIQYIIMSWAEILGSVTALRLAYEEAPATMKSLMQAVYLITIFAGNMIVVLISATGGHTMSPSTSCFMYAGLVLIAGLFNWFLIRIVNKKSSNNTEIDIRL